MPRFRQSGPEPSRKGQLGKNMAPQLARSNEPKLKGRGTFRDGARQFQPDEPGLASANLYIWRTRRRTGRSVRRGRLPVASL
jgi:hypothetical protein